LATITFFYNLPNLFSATLQRSQQLKHSYCSEYSRYYETGEYTTVLSNPIPGNGSVNTFSQQRRQQTEMQLETVFSIRAEQSGYKEDNWGDPLNSRVEAGSKTSIVTLRVVGGDEEGSLESETAKYGRESHGTRTRE
jgi:hypothetical protein